MNYVDVLCHLVAFDTSGASGAGCRDAISYLNARFSDVGCESTIVSIPPDHADGLDGRVALISHLRQPNRPRLLVYTHVDVVPVDGWDGFTPRMEAGRMYGRGVADMKGAIAALLGALSRVRNVDLAYDLSVIVTMDEETHQMSQLCYLDRFLDPGRRPHVLSLDSGYGYVSIGNLGLLQMDVAVRGLAAHSGLSHMGRNAVEGATLLMSELLRHKESVVSRRAGILAHPDTGLDCMEARLNINCVSGGIARNVVPDACEFSIDRRLVPDEDLDSVREEILSALERVSGVEWEVVREFSIPPVPPCDDPQARVLASIVDRVMGSSGMYGDMLSGELPAAAGTLWGASAFATGLIRPDSHIHGVDEYIYTSDLDRLVEVLARFLTGDRKEAA